MTWTVVLVSGYVVEPDGDGFVMRPDAAVSGDWGPIVRVEDLPGRGVHIEAELDGDPEPEFVGSPGYVSNEDCTGRYETRRGGRYRHVSLFPSVESTEQMSPDLGEPWVDITRSGRSYRIAVDVDRDGVLEAEVEFKAR